MSEDHSALQPVAGFDVKVEFHRSHSQAILGRACLAEGVLGVDFGHEIARLRGGNFKHTAKREEAINFWPVLGESIADNLARRDLLRRLADLKLANADIKGSLRHGFPD